MLCDDALEQFQLRAGQGARGGYDAESIQYLGKGVAANRVVVDRFQGFAACHDGPAHHLSRESASSKRAVRGRVVLLWAEAVSTEHERPVHVEQHTSEAGEDTGWDHARPRRVTPHTARCHFQTTSSPSLLQPG